MSLAQQKVTHMSSGNISHPSVRHCADKIDAIPATLDNERDPNG